MEKSGREPNTREIGTRQHSYDQLQPWERWKRRCWIATAYNKPWRYHRGGIVRFHLDIFQCTQKVLQEGECVNDSFASAIDSIRLFLGAFQSERREISTRLLDLHGTHFEQSFMSLNRVPCSLCHWDFIRYFGHYCIRKAQCFDRWLQVETRKP